MNLSLGDLSVLADLAIAAAIQAGKMIARSRPLNVEHKLDGTSLASQVVTEIDRRSENMILEILTPTFARFDLGLLTEERDDDGSRLTTDYFWCIDPLDGTLPFVEGSSGYAVSIALVGRDGTPHIGVVYDPVEGTLWHAVSGAGVFRDGQPWSAELQVGTPSRQAGVLSVFADRSFAVLPGHEDLIEALDQAAQDMGLAGVRLHATAGAVMNACSVLAHPPACYFKFSKPTGGGSLWDFAATACLVHEAGAIATDIHGDPLDLNRADSTFMNHRGVLFATDEALAALIRTLAPQ